MYVQTNRLIQIFCSKVVQIWPDSKTLYCTLSQKQYCVFLSFNVVCQTFCNYIQYTVNNMLCDSVRTVYTVQFTVYKK